MKELIKETIRLLEKKESVVWATIVEHSGSTPRKSTARMLIRADSGILGSIGGGRLEAAALQIAKNLHTNPGAKLIEFSMTGQEVAETEMICGGQAKIFVESLSPNALPIVAQLYDGLTNKRDVIFLTWIDTMQRSFAETHFIIDRSGKRQKPLGTDDVIITEIERGIKRGDGQTLFSHPGGDGVIFLEYLERSSRLYIFGGGHISLDLAWMAHRVGFEIVIIDDRKDFANHDRFPMASDVWAMPYKEAFNNCHLGHDDFAVIVTRGHLYDLEVLREVIKQSPDYIGMIGSRRKKAMIFDQLHNEGISQKQLDQVHAPVGLNIKAETPAEISVSIIAEIIQVRAEIKKSANGI